MGNKSLKAIVLGALDRTGSLQITSRLFFFPIKIMKVLPFLGYKVFLFLTFENILLLI